MAPAQRADLIVDIIGPVGFDMVTRQGPYRLADLAVSGTNTDRKAGPIRHCTTQPAASRRTHSAPDIDDDGRCNGWSHGGDNIWAFNNVSDLPTGPFGSFKRGETVQMTMVNDTKFAHGIHLHGHHFYEVDEEGVLGNLRDTTLVNARESRDIICVFDNPGRWLLHCHMLSHAFGGMRTWVNVA